MTSSKEPTILKIVGHRDFGPGGYYFEVEFEGSKTGWMSVENVRKRKPDLTKKYLKLHPEVK
ncbi:hypothetical protein Cantr_09385 [Candida viswanathii]|uniref:Chromo domain-containing protein n=1 Tax=Candida viswanathii TaxID=5486 RepID=A0A367Y0E5_9ASCO|nr:hypothetical protein Cantr_07523 [Candida viswanathii]RCK62884.1 hypothetical protein Cantr_09385 [Candida viswanathii]